MTIDYQRKGITLFSVDGLAGAIFYHSGVKPGKFGLTQTTRETSSLWDNLRAIVAGNYPSVWLVGEVLSKQENFSGNFLKGRNLSGWNEEITSNFDLFCNELLFFF